MYGPKNGIIFVTPTTTLTRSADLIPIIYVPIKQITPIISESTSLPIKKPLNILSA